MGKGRILYLEAAMEAVFSECLLTPSKEVHWLQNRRATGSFRRGMNIEHTKGTIYIYFGQLMFMMAGEWVQKRLAD
jgi:hypothetical protein